MWLYKLLTKRISLALEHQRTAIRSQARYPQTLPPEIFRRIEARYFPLTFFP